MRDLLPLSALQHLLFCERQCALIHVERLWAENRLTAEGRQLHSKVHAADVERRTDRRFVRGLELSSQQLGLYGFADVVEFESGKPPRPVEYKRGRPKMHSADAVQLCAQGMCLEEMLATSVPEGSLFYGRPRRRLNIQFDATLRDATESAARHLHALFATGVTPKAHREPKCDHCSLLDICLPGALRPRATACIYFESSIDQMLTT